MNAARVTRPAFIRNFIGALLITSLAACGGGGGEGTAGDPTVVPASPGGQAVNGSISLQWSAPVARADNTPLSPSEIGGYRVYYGTTEGRYSYSVDISDGSAEQLTLGDIPGGTYYFVVTAYDSDGRESVYSAVVQKDI